MKQGPVELPPEVAQAFANDMRDYFALSVALMVPPI